MALTRPLKEGSVTTYQAKVAAGFPDILASEMDADLDTIYAAWNGGVGTANLSNGSVTYAKLAPDAQLWSDTGTVLTPGTNFTGRPILANGEFRSGPGTIKGSFSADSAGQLYILSNNVFAPADATKVSWMMQFGPTTDNFNLNRRPANAASGSGVNLLTVDMNGRLYVTPPDGSWSEIWAVGNSSVGGLFKSKSSRGTIAAPTPTLSGDMIGQWSANGCYQNGAFSEQAMALFSASANWTATGRGVQFIVRTTPDTSTTPSSQLTFDSSGQFVITGSIGQKASGTTWANPSDRRLKDDIEDYPTGLGAILRLQPRTFLYNGKGGSTAGLRGYGFVADEIAGIMPETVSVRPAKLDPDDADDTDIETLDQSNLILALVNATKELAARVAALEA